MYKRNVCLGHETRQGNGKRGGSYLKREGTRKGHRKHTVREGDGRRYRMRSRGRDSGGALWSITSDNNVEAGNDMIYCLLLNSYDYISGPPENSIVRH